MERKPYKWIRLSVSLYKQLNQRRQEDTKGLRTDMNPYVEWILQRYIAREIGELPHASRSTGEPPEGYPVITGRPKPTGAEKRKPLASRREE